ncbi:MAG: hypothetical protein ACTHWO_00435 [Nesterenkonia sp.]
MVTAAAVTGIYRPGYPFTAAELQTMTGQGVLRHMLADVYAECRLPETGAVRATAAAALLSTTLRARGALCGETAAWVHLGLAPPHRAQVITQGVYRRPTDGAWQVYQVPLTQDETQRTGRMVTTTPTRTAADIYCGIGAAGSRRSLDHLVDGEGLNDQLLYWPSSADPLHERDHGVWNASPADEQGTAHRMSLIGELLHHSAATQEGVLAAVVRTLALPGLRSRRAARAADLLDQCASRRFPTVR